MPSPISFATGRRKTSVARVRLYAGTGKTVLTGKMNVEKNIDQYFPTHALRQRALDPIKSVNLESKYDIHAQLEGGGTTGQADALRLGIARALVKLEPELRGELKREGFLRRDDRQVERKKYGLRKARRAPQFTKR